MSISMAIGLVFSPLIIAIFFKVKFMKLREKEYFAKYGSLYAT